ncbi:MAG: flavodoxin [Lachnospiraceae bacterium]|nr:flavodoxin [Lachnospiraceae bacterium]MDD3617089.1 flavodoxin [Lachnospiraceae bacterium]
MKKRWCTLCKTVLIICFLTACGDEAETEQTIDKGQQRVEKESEQRPDITDLNGDEVLVAYFTRLPNTESGDNLDAVVQGGGPYGAIGESFESADMDAISSASITVTDEGVKGNVETVAGWIAEYTGGELFSIETLEKYPLDYDTLINQGGEEQQNNVRPQLVTHVENIENYNVIYLGYPNWYHDMPMALYSFLEEYDLSGKTIIPFVTSASSGLANTVSTIAEMQPEADVIEDGLELVMGDVKNSKEEVTNWVDSLGIQ